MFENIRSIEASVSWCAWDLFTEIVNDHYSDIIMGAMASKITSLTNVYSAVYSGAHERKHQSSASLAFVRGIHRWPVNSPHKWRITRKCFHLMTSSFYYLFHVTYLYDNPISYRKLHQYSSNCSVASQSHLFPKILPHQHWFYCTHIQLHPYVWLRM